MAADVVFETEELVDSLVVGQWGFDKDAVDLNGIKHEWDEFGNEIITFPYHRPDNGRQVVYGELEKPFARYRRISNGGGGARGPKYMQVSNSGVHTYWPRNSPTLWTKAREDVSVDVIITEGEKKAIVACQNGLQCIAVPGVYCFREKGEEKLEEWLEWFQWRGKITCQAKDGKSYTKMSGRKVFICYDSDFKTNPQVRAAARKLADMLAAKGADVFYTLLPEDDLGQKVGLDDYLLVHGIDAFKKLIEKSVSLTENSIVDQMNENLVLISGAFYDKKLKKFVREKELRNDYRNAECCVQDIDDTGEIVERWEHPLDLWLDSPFREQARRIDYLPGKGKYFTDEKGLKVYNAWEKSHVEAIEGDITPFTDFLNLMLGLLDEDIEKEIREDREGDLQYLLDWITYPIQYPGTKQCSCVFLVSQKHGCGKGTLQQMIRGLYGDNGGEIKDASDFFANFNTFQKNKEFLMGEEIISRGDKVALINKLKNIITQQTIHINEKFQIPYEQRDCVNYMFSSNSADPIIIEEDDRRFFMLDVRGIAYLRDADGKVIKDKFGTEIKDADYYGNLRKWYEEGGREHLRYYFEHRKISEGYNPYDAARTTPEKRVSSNLSKSDFSLAIADLVAPESLDLFSEKRDIFCSSELDLMLRALHTEINFNAIKNPNQIICKELVNLGVQKAFNGERVHRRGHKGTWFIMRNADRYKNDSAAIDANIKDNELHEAGFGSIANDPDIEELDI